MNTEPPTANHNFLDLTELLATVLNRKKTIGITMLCTLLLAVFYLHIATYRYTVLLKVAPAQNNSSSSSRGIAGALNGSGIGDIASMAGINLSGGASGSPFQLYIESLPSRSVADIMVRRTDLMKVVFEREWDEETHTWHEPRGLLHSIARSVEYALGMPLYKWQPPDGGRLQAYIENNVSITQSSKQVLVTVAMVQKDPAFAVQFLQALHETTDDQLRQKAFVRSSQYIAYLNQILPSVTVAEQRQAIASSLSEQEKNLMMAGSHAPYAAEPFGNPYATEMPTTPAPLIILPVAVVAGFFLGVILAVILSSGWIAGLRSAIKRSRKDKPGNVQSQENWRYSHRPAGTVLEQEKSSLS